MKSSCFKHAERGKWWPSLRQNLIRSDSIKIIEAVLARCVKEPWGSHGLEGYGLGQSYRFERYEDGKGRYCRVYPDGSFHAYYETCGEIVFAGYFEPVTAPA
jgi:hypothetical protein